MRATLMACVFVLLCFPALAAEKPAEKREPKPVEWETPKVDSAKPCSDIYRVAEESSQKRSDSMDQAAREAMVRSSSPLGKVLHQLSCLLVST